MTDALAITVIIPVFNAAPFVERAIGSVLAQSLPAAEILVVDDCSTDATRDIVATLALRHPNVRLLCMAANGGPSAARNTGIAQATGDWIAILDADDAYGPDRLAALAGLVARDPAADIVADDLLYYDAAAARTTGRALGPRAVPDGPVGVETYLAHNLADGRGPDWGLLKPMIRCAFLLSSGVRYVTAQRHGEDFTFMVTLLLHGARFRMLDAAHYLYTQREGAVSRKASDMTRTTIAYGALARAAIDLTGHPAIRATPGLAALLLRRAEGLSRLDDAHFFSQAIRRGAVGALAARALRRPSFVPRIGRQVGRALHRRIAIWRSA
ncbi:glycosyltransferase family 2 protein [Gluconacetobacter azotocaptans]|uniref:Glycosyltransferase family 2 protein n=1 Tax=Gluconacetobacter azotocaptans TaxID=142834 RepID=A0A7W4PDM2_9PROT|nr:glycosyltransferase family A protein [Gluconacetobacter azotocaptans]MBB2188534.1 glycosyltransferase family 2 protein [Gluconacetobacter azotocaptans]MBM9400240.1 glycosyltransferase family 2 protein [Gluconacetobacter azotocaptans]GBQ28086.1 glycosyltransferase [Gluconacetobacter azotocaptans DSM 13594]